MGRHPAGRRGNPRRALGRKAYFVEARTSATPTSSSRSPRRWRARSGPKPAQNHRRAWLQRRRRRGLAEIRDIRGDRRADFVAARYGVVGAAQPYETLANWSNKARRGAIETEARSASSGSKALGPADQPGEDEPQHRQDRHPASAIRLVEREQRLPASRMYAPRGCRIARRSSRPPPAAQSRSRSKSETPTKSRATHRGE